MLVCSEELLLLITYYSLLIIYYSLLITYYLLQTLLIKCFCQSGNARKMNDGIVSKSIVYFSNTGPNAGKSFGPEPLKLRKIVDMVGVLQTICFHFYQMPLKKLCLLQQ